MGWSTRTVPVPGGASPRANTAPSAVHHVGTPVFPTPAPPSHSTEYHSLRAARAAALQERPTGPLRRSTQRQAPRRRTTFPRGGLAEERQAGRCRSGAKWSGSHLACSLAHQTLRLSGGRTTARSPLDRRRCCQPADEPANQDTNALADALGPRNHLRTTDGFQRFGSLVEVPGPWRLLGLTTSENSRCVRQVERMDRHGS